VNNDSFDVQKYAFLLRNEKKNAFLCFFLMKVLAICGFFAIFANCK